MKYNRYPVYKNSEVAWLGEIPEKWKLQSGKSTFIQTRNKSNAKDVQLSATQKYGVIPQYHFMELEEQKVMLALKGTENFKHVDIDDFVISLRSFEGGIEHCHYSGCVSPAYTVLKSRIEIVPDFFTYMFKSQPFIKVIQSVSEGIRDGKTITYDQFSKITLPIPPLREQSDIANFLKTMISKIDISVLKQRILIELLKEKRQAIITQAVTKGLDPNVPKKDSGIEWIGEIPEDWDLGRIKDVVSSIGSGGTPDTSNENFWTDSETGIPWVAIADMSNVNQVGRTENCITKLALEQKNLRIWPVGTVLFSMYASLGHVALLGVPATINQAILAITPMDGFNRDYLIHWFHFLKPYLGKFASNNTQDNLNLEKVRNLPILLPSKEKQKKISIFLKKKTDELEILITKQKEMIELLKEHKTSLINQAVTGKIDISGQVQEVGESA